VRSLPRPALIGIVGVVAVLALFMLTRKGGEEQTAAPAVPAAPAPSTATPVPSTAAPTQTPAPSGSATAPATQETQPVSDTAGPPATKARTLPEKVSKALAAKKVVVLLFWNPKGTDDRSVKSAVDGLSRKNGKVAVFTDKPENVGRYAKIFTAVELTQTPTLIVANDKDVARKATGYLDPVTVEQYVVDALHGKP
jgi:hypothetical protein